MAYFAGIINLAILAVFLAFWSAAFAVFYHLTRFGVGILPKRLSALFLIGAMLIFAISIVLYQKVDLTTILS